MKEILDFLNAAKIFYLATSDGEIPHVRPLGFAMEHDGKIMYCTSNKKDMYKQMKANPNVEISCVNEDMVTLRITGHAVFVTSEQTQEKALEIMPMLKNMYAVSDGKFEIFYIENMKATTTTMGGETKVLAQNTTIIFILMA